KLPKNRSLTRSLLWVSGVLMDKFGLVLDCLAVESLHLRDQIHRDDRIDAQPQKCEYHDDDPDDCRQVAENPRHGGWRVTRHRSITHDRGVPGLTGFHSGLGGPS